MNNQPQEYYTPYQLKFPIEIEKIIETTDPVYTFCEVMNHIDLSKYLTTEDRRTGRPRYEEETLLKVILFAFMENGYESLRKNRKNSAKPIFALCGCCRIILRQATRQ